MPDVILFWHCPTACGECCFGPAIRACRPLKAGWCKHHSATGCRLPRQRRPHLCNTYLCPEVAENTEGYAIHA
jgi:hypothetical protein